MPPVPVQVPAPLLTIPLEPAPPEWPRVLVPAPVILSPPLAITSPPSPPTCPPVKVVNPLTVKSPAPRNPPPKKSNPTIPASNDRVEFPLLIIALSPTPGTPVGDQLVSTPKSPVPPNHVRSTAKAGWIMPDATIAAAIGNI